MGKISIEVSYALPDEQVIIPLQVEQGTTIEEAIHTSGILDRFQEVGLDTNKVGIFGHAERLDKILDPMDRIEIYRPITCDPKEVRRQRAKKKARKKKTD